MNHKPPSPPAVVVSDDATTVVLADWDEQTAQWRARRPIRRDELLEAVRGPVTTTRSTRPPRRSPRLALPAVTA